MNWVSDLIFALVFTCITGSMLTAVWLIARKCLVNIGDSKIIYRFLRLIMLGYALPVTYGILKWRNIHVDGIEGWLFNLTPSIVMVMRILLAVWGIGITVHILLHALNSVRCKDVYKKRLCATCFQKEQLKKQCREMGIHRKIGLFQCYGIASPCIAGFFAVRINLPVREYAEKELQMIFMHELSHYRQGDIFWKPLFTVLRYVYWFDPLVILAYKEMNCWAENCCDIACCEKYNAGEYFRAILNMIPEGSGSTVSFVPMWFEHNEQLKWRIQYIKKKKEGQFSRKWAARAVAALVVAGGVLAAGIVDLKAAELYDLAYEKTVVSTEEEIMPEEPMEEFTGTTADFEGLIIEEDSDSTELTQNTATINWTLKNFACRRSSKFYKTKGSAIQISFMVDPENKYINAGLVQPDSTTLYVKGKGIVTHTFPVKQSGYYQIFVSNQSGGSVIVSGAYRK